MEEFLIYLQGNVPYLIITFLCSVLTFVLRSLKSFYKSKTVYEQSIANAVQSILRMDIIEYYQKIEKQGYCSIYDKENMKLLYLPYKELGGNNIADSIFKKVMSMETKEEKTM